MSVFLRAISINPTIGQNQTSLWREADSRPDIVHTPRPVIAVCYERLITLGSARVTTGQADDPTGRARWGASCKNAGRMNGFRIEVIMPKPPPRQSWCVNA